MTVEGSGATPYAYREEKTFEQLFRFELLPDKAALLTIDEFYWRDKPKFYEFTRTVVQDKGFGTLIGVGGIQFIKLPHTQMTIVVPRFVLTRTSGRDGLLQPDVLIVSDPFRPMSAIESILRLER